MPIQLHNSLSHTKEDLIPQTGKTIRIYSCGVTVYDRCHIGHGRSLYIFDVLRRYLKYRGFDVYFVRNITDVDDKIIDKAKQTGKPFAEVVKENIDAYYQDLSSLGIDKADREPRATENIPDMIKDIGLLIKKELAYQADGDVYFDVRKFKGYGKLSGQSIEKLRDSVRIESDVRKKDPLDFALWKSSKEGEPSWDSPWGKGRPGWHIECSTMSMKYLNAQTLDIHAGGRDLIFPHHENEIAQSEGLTGMPFAKYWIHHGLLTINGQKMAKSLGNFVTIQDALKKYTVDELKFFFLSAHYASPLDFTDEKMLEARKALQKIDILFWKASDILENKDAHLIKVDFIEHAKQKFLEALDDDLNTPKALASVFDFINDTNKYIDGFAKDAAYADAVYSAVETLENLLKDIFGLFGKEHDKALSPEQTELLEKRKEARKQKDFKRSDELRVLLQQQGIVVEDSKEGQAWRWA